MNKYIAIDLFCGAGGLSVGLKKAGFSLVLANEIEKDFAATYQLNHPGVKMINKDIHQVDFSKEIKALGSSPVHLVAGGPPCQGFSTVGAKNKKDPRNSLFFEFLRALSEIKPFYIFFENVAGFSKMYQGEAYRTLLSELDALEYNVISGVLEASEFGLPQKRHRTIIIGWNKQLPPVCFPKPNHCENPNFLGLKPKITLMEAISDLPELELGSFVKSYASEPQNPYQEKLRSQVSELTEHNCANYGSKMREILSLIPSGGSVKDLPDRLKPKNYFSNTYARLLPHTPSPTITRNFGTPSSSRCIHPFQNRALSTREGARLQGFADDFIFVGSKGSKNLQIGNAVPPVIGEVVAKEILLSFERSLADAKLLREIG